MILLKVSGILPNLEVFDEWVDLVEILAKCIGGGGALAILFVEFFMCV